MPMRASFKPSRGEEPPRRQLRSTHAEASAQEEPSAKKRKVETVPATAAPRRGRSAAQPIDVDKTRGASKPPASKPPASKPPASKPRAAAERGTKRTPAIEQAAGLRRPLKSARVDGETFRPGNSVYVVLDESCLADLEDAGEEEFECEVCGSAGQDACEMLECERCLGGFHLDCLSPPLREVPQGTWVCGDCEAGNVQPRASATGGAAGRFLARRGLALARIESLWEQRGAGAADRFHCVLRWYCLPEETHIGRQAHHGAREVFLTNQCDVNSLAAVLRCAAVALPHEFAAHPGPDAFVCEYQYDMQWRCFRRLGQAEGEESETEGDAGGDWWAPGDGGSSSDDEDGGSAFDPDELRELEPGNETRGCARPGRGRKGGRKQGGDDGFEHVGVGDLPEHIARRRAAGGGLARARGALALSAPPRVLPCRDGERALVVQFVEEVLHDDSGLGKCLYISGVPGTGKTATVLAVLRALRRRAEAGALPRFRLVELNGLRLPAPQHAYSALHEALTGQRLGPPAALRALERRFCRSGGNTEEGEGEEEEGGGEGQALPTVLLVDEMDLLLNKTQAVLYNLFDWPLQRGSRLSIIAIANTMDLPERLHPRIGSRLAGRRLVFHPYNRDQLIAIMRSRLEDGEPAQAGKDGARDAPVGRYDFNAVQLVARKVANCSGDVRRCLELCRRAAEIAEEEQLAKQRGLSTGGGEAGVAAAAELLGDVRVTIRHADAAIREMFHTFHVALARGACRAARLLLGALWLEVKFTGRVEVELGSVAERLRAMCSAGGEPQIPASVVLRNAMDLDSQRLVICDPGAKRLHAKVALNIPTDDLLHALESDPDLPWLHRMLTA